MPDVICQTCGKELDHPALTHCSNECIFAKLWHTESVSDMPIETWGDTENTWR